MKRIDTAEQEHKIQRQQDLERSTLTPDCSDSVAAAW